ncbi:MAG: hypothetical protein IJM76_05795 [Lachnospiraceae bacterium]|nr:hypothetical protein [Lachnospiraceae bacterium]
MAKVLGMWDVKEYEIAEYKKAFSVGTDAAWKKYWANVKRAVSKYNKTHAEKIDIDLLTE